MEFIVTDPQGRKLKVTGNAPPTEQELEEIFNSVPQATPESLKALEGLEAERERDVDLFLKSGGSPKATSGLVSSELKRARRMVDLERQGVVTDEPLPTGDLEFGFAQDPVEGVQRSLTEHFQTPVKVFKDQEDILFIDPTDQKTKLANPNFAGQIGKALTPAGDIIGTIGGGALAVRSGRVSPKALVAAETIGSGVGTSSMEFVRLAIGNVMGVNELTLGEMQAASLGEGLKAAGATALTGGALALFKGTKNFLEGGIFTKDEAAKHGLSVKEADAAIAEVNKLTGKDSVKGTLGKKTDDVEVQSAEAEIRKKPGLAQEFADRDVADQAGLVEALEVVTKPSKAKGGEAVSEVLEKQVEKRLTQAKGIVATNKAEFKSQLDDIGKQAKETIGEPTRQVILAKRKVEKDAENKAFADARKLGGFSKESNSFGIDIPQGINTAKLRSQLKRRAETATTKIARKGTTGIFNPKSKKADLADFNREISDLKAELRTIKNNKQFGDPNTRDLSKVIGALEEDRRLALVEAGRGDLLESLEKAETQTREFHEQFSRSVIGDLTEKNKNGVFKIKAKDFVDKTLKGDVEETRQLLGVVGDQPTLMNQWKEGIADAYKRVAFPDDKFNRRASEKFIAAHRDNLELFFKEGELNKWSRVGGLAQKVEKQSKQLDQIIKQANNKFGRGKLKSLDPDNLVKFVTNETGSFITPAGRGVQAMKSKISFVKNITKNHPEAWRSFQEEFSTKTRDQIFDTRKGRIDPKKISDLVTKQGDAVEAVMGVNYLNDLKKINEVVQILSRPLSKLQVDEGKGVIIQAIRGTAAPPLTRRGRAFTAAVLFDNKRAHESMAKALLNPVEIHKIAKLSEHNRITREVAELAVSLGMITDEE